MAWHHLTTAIAPFSDLAADMLLQNRIVDDGALLVGHYSRWGFNHPGPFWFYYNHLFEVALNWTGLSRSQIWQIGSVAINSVLILFSALSLSHYLLRKFDLYYCFAFVLILLAVVGGDIVSVWMPNRLLMPYLAFLISLLHIQDGNSRYIALSIFTASTLIHGYATMPIFTIPLLTLALMLGWSRNRNLLGFRDNAGQVLCSLLIIAIFCAPIVANTLSEPTDNLSKLLSVQASFSSMAKPSWDEMRLFIDQLIFRDNAIGWMISPVLFALILVVSNLRPNQRKRLFCALAICLLVSLLTLVYHKQTPSPLHAFIARFYVAVPVLFVAAIISSLFMKDWNHERAPGFNKSMLRVSSPALLLAVWLSFGLPFEKLQAPAQGIHVRQFAAFLEKKHDTRSISIDYSEHEQWHFIAGLMLELDRRQISACSTWRHMAFLYTDNKICPAGQVSTVKIIAAEQCGGTCLFANAGFGLKNGLTAGIKKEPKEPNNDPEHSNDDTQPGLYAGHTPAPSLGLPYSNIGVFDPADNVVYSCIRILSERTTAGGSVFPESAITLQVISAEEGIVRLIDSRELRSSDDVNDNNETSNCSGVFDTRTDRYHDFIQYNDTTMQMTFELVDAEAMELKLLNSIER